MICVAGFEDVPALDYRADDEQCNGLAGARVGGLEGCHVICVALVAKAGIQAHANVGVAVRVFDERLVSSFEHCDLYSAKSAELS